MKRTAMKRKSEMSRASKPLSRSAKPLRAVRAKKAEHRRPVTDDGFGEPYLAFVRTLPCCVSGLGGCDGDVVPHHTRDGHQRVHRDTVPLCYVHHRLRWHQWGTIAPMTREETVALFDDEKRRRQDEWRRAA